MQVDDQIAVSSAAVEAPEAEAPMELGEAEQAAFLSREDRSQTADQFFKERGQKPAEPVPAKSEATPEAAKQPEADTGKPQGRGLDKRLSQLAEKNAALRQQLAEKKQLTEALRQYEQPTKQPTAVQQQPETSKAPKLADFDDFDAYEAAREAHFEKLAEAKAESKFKAWQEEQLTARAQAEWDERATKVGIDPKQLLEVTKTYAALVDAGEAPGFSQVMVETINDPSTEAGPAVTLHLIENPSEVQRIAGLSPVAQVRELDRLAASLKGEAAPAKQAAAVAPIGKPVSKISAATLPAAELSGSAPELDQLSAAAASNDLNAWRRAKQARGGDIFAS